jgi:hypothetical protein
MRTLLLLLCAAAVSGGAFAPRAGAQSPTLTPPARSTPAQPTPARTPPAPAELNASERALVQSSREAIIRTGITANYFDRHFSVARVVDSPGNRRVVWKFSVGEYEATVNDSVGSYTEGGRRLNAHSVAGTLASTSDIERTITRRRAEAIMRRCIGAFEEPQVEYRANGPAGRAALLLTAHRVVAPPPESRAARERREREEREQLERVQSQSGSTRDTLRNKKGPPRPVILLGAVDLSTGRCTVGRAQAGAPRP